MQANGNGELVYEVRVSWMDALQDQFGSTPWWLASILLHAVVILLLMMYTVLGPRPEPEKTIVFHPVATPPEVTKPIIRETPQETPVEPVLTDVEVPQENVGDPNAPDIPDVLKGTNGLGDTGISDLDSTVPILGVNGNEGGRIGNPGLGIPDIYTRRIRYIDHPPDPNINLALEWLARHQEADGHWDGEKYEGEDTDAGITGLATIAFLGCGYTERTGKYRATVVRAVNWMISQQGEDGCIGRASTKGGLGYHHAICGMALAQAWAMGRVVPTGTAAQKAVDYSVNAHQVPYSGWRYNARQEADTSVTGWFIMQLKSAKVAGLKVPSESFQGAINFLDKVTDTTNYSGRAGYQTKEQVSRTLTAVALTSRLFMGWKPQEPMMRGAADFIMESLPDWNGQNEGINFYYWYYASLAMFQMGPDYWNRWNVAMKNALIPTQRKGGDEDGSWDPIGQWSSRGGRVYSTALGALCLETFMLYNPLYK
jgi:hypothetical protein